MKAQGAHLIGYNEITKKPTIKIDLSKAISIEQSHDPVNNPKGSYAMDDEELDENYHVERSFRITFKDGEKISFFADTDEEMKKWLAALSKVVGNGEIPANCVWASVATEMIKAAKDKNEAGKTSGSISTNSVVPPPSASKRVPVPSVEGPQSQKQQQQRVVSGGTPIYQRQQAPPPSATSLRQGPPSASQTPMNRPRLQDLGQGHLSAVQEVATPEQTPTRRPQRPASAHITQQSYQTPKGRMNVERPASVYIDGRS